MTPLQIFTAGVLAGCLTPLAFSLLVMFALVQLASGPEPDL